MADKLLNELWNKETLQLPLTITPSDDATPSYATTRQNKVAALAATHAEKAFAINKYLKHHDATKLVIKAIKNQLEEKKSSTLS
jgi:hypothetical protein